MFIAMAFWKKSSERVSQYIMPDPHSAVEIIRERAATLRAGVTAAALAGMLCALSLASYAAELNYTPVQPPLISVDWQNPMSVPLRFRNHCHFDAFGRYYCSNHCGLDYQFYYCSEASFGCCHPGYGYCSWDGMLRCAP
jgi:hypothetical protein